LARRRADRMRLAFKPTGQGRQVWRDKRHRLGGEAAERTLIATMAERRVLDGRFVVVDLNAELRRVAEQRLELGGDRSVIGAGESGRGERWRGRGGEKLNDQRKRDEERGQRRSERRQATLSASRPKRRHLAPQAHQQLPPRLHSVDERTPQRNCKSAWDNAPYCDPAPAQSLILFCSKQICALSAPRRHLNVCVQFGVSGLYL